MEKLACEMSLNYNYDKKVFDFPQITSSYQLYELLNEIWEPDIQLRERFKILLFNKACNLLGYSEISVGGTSSTVIDYKFIVATACLANSERVVIAHNHPTGNTKPSQPDIRETRKLVEILNLLDIKIMDHVILCKNAYYSFADNGII